MSVRYEDQVEAAKMIVTNYMKTTVMFKDAESNEDRLNNELDFLVNEFDRYEYADERFVEKFNYASEGDGSLDGVSSAIKDTSILRDATRIMIADRVIELRKLK